MAWESPIAMWLMNAGVRCFDSAVGGVGGNRMVKGSVSNVSTEELVFMFQALGVDTGIEFETLIEAGQLVEGMIDRLEAPPSAEQNPSQPR